ncbi:hypothetical protein XH92_37600 [Bradyrhizobium sp. CCBAU 53421]|nr:hypothetical protein XH92_37600 [Bradyrhizobium sp. CCBAU 53421]
MTSRIHHVVAAFGSAGTFSRPDPRTIGIQDANAPKDNGLAEDQVRIIAGRWINRIGRSVSQGSRTRIGTYFGDLVFGLMRPFGS